MLKSQLDTVGGTFTLSDNLVLISEKKIILLYCPFCGAQLAKDKIVLHSEMPTSEQVAALESKIEQVKSAEDIQLVFGKPTKIITSPQGSGARRLYFEDGVPGLRVIVQVDVDGKVRYLWSAKP